MKNLEELKILKQELPKKIIFKKNEDGKYDMDNSVVDEYPIKCALYYLKLNYLVIKMHNEFRKRS